MVSLRHSDDGFATAAAMTVSVCMAMIAGGVTVAGVAELKRSRAAFARTQVEYALEEAQTQAVMAVLENGASGRLSWQVGTDLGQAKVLAEPESAKASFAKAAAAGDDQLEKLGVDDPDELKTRLAGTPPDSGDQAWIASLDSASLWRACAASLISRYGQGATLALTSASPPDAQGFSWRPGEVWRVRTQIDGWADDRLVRFTGRDDRPAVTIERRFSRTQGEDNRCDAIFSQSA